MLTVGTRFFSGIEPYDERGLSFSLSSRYSYLTSRPDVDQTSGGEETVMSPGVLGPTNGISNDVGGALPVESASQTVCINAHGTKTGIPPRKVGGKRGTRSKHQIRPENEI